ncbi:hypothetical protein SCHPADRAFT_896819 [Schizopora paradoxa]|uniref:Uncharacterized protein n=1 Tax=Schizopora paradoxa TaxID=27342 RepID=A0A0H2QZA0_9AGAM|nr:hypothetical protein SCHPADRAFT_896819 [Schizopora paradoxa]
MTLNLFYQLPDKFGVVGARNMSSKEEINLEKPLSALSRNKLVSKNMVKNVRLTKLQALCKSMQIEVLGQLKPDYVDALQRWTSTENDDEFRRLSNVVEAMDNMALRQRASEDLVTGRKKSEIGHSESHQNQVYISGLQLAPLGNVALSNVAMGHQLAGSAIPTTSFAASYASLAQSGQNHNISSYLPSFSSPGLTSSPANARIDTQLLPFHLPDRGYQSSDRTSILEVSPIDGEVILNDKNTRNVVALSTNKRRRLNTLPEVNKPSAVASNRPGETGKAKEKNPDKEKPKTIYVRLYNSPTNWRHLRQEVCPLEPYGGLNLDALNIMFGFPEGISSRVIHPKTRRPVFMADGQLLAADLLLDALEDYQAYWTKRRRQEGQRKRTLGREIRIGHTSSARPSRATILYLEIIVIDPVVVYHHGNGYKTDNIQNFG